jgi:hypothetical protein
MSLGSRLTKVLKRLGEAGRCPGRAPGFSPARARSWTRWSCPRPATTAASRSASTRPSPYFIFIERGADEAGPGEGG